MDTAQKPSTGAIKLRIDTLLGRDSHLFTTTIFVLLGAIFLIASYAPEGYTTEYRSIMDCSQYAYTIQDYNCKPFNMATNPTIAVEVTDIGHRDKFLVLELSPLQMNSHEHIDITAQLTVGVYALDSQDSQGNKKGALLTTVNKNVEFDCSYSQEEPCNTVEVYTIPKIESKGYYFTVTFVNNNDISAQVSNFQVSTKTLNLSYRNYKFAVKFVFVAITALTLLAHFIKMSNLKKDFFTQEQKLIPFIAPSLLTINEPFTIHLFEGVMYSWATIFSFVVFSALLMWLWILVIDNLAGSDSSLIDKSSLFAKVYTPIYFVVLFITYGTLGHLALKDPMFNFHSTSNLSFNLFKYILFGVLIIGVLWMVKKSVSIYRRMNDLNERENAFYWFSVFFILSHFYFIATGGLFPFNYDLCGLLLFNGISTLYVFSSSYLFLPTQEGIEQANYLKKYQNPAVKNSYKDLEESVDHTQKNNNKETHQTDTHTEDKDKPLGQMQSQGVSLERNPAVIQYPYEQKAEEDF